MSRAIGAKSSGGGGRHLLAAGLTLSILAAWAGAVAATVHGIGTRPDRSGALVAIFPRSLDDRQVLARVARAQGSLIGATWLANVWHVYGKAPEFAGALRAQGASLVLPPLPLAVLGTGGCFGMPPAGAG